MACLAWCLTHGTKGGRHAQAAARPPPKDLGEERQVRKLAGSRHAAGTGRGPPRSPPSWAATRRRSASVSGGLPPRAWAGWGPARRRAPTAADQAPAQPAHRPGPQHPARAAAPPGRWSPGGPTTSATRPTGPWMGSPAPLTGWASGSSAARCARSCLASGSAGAHPAPGQQRRPDFAAKNPGRRALHPPAQGRDGRLRPWRGAGVVYGALRSVTARSAPSPPLAQHRRLEAAAAGDRAGQPDRGAPGGQRQPVQPPQPGAAGVAGRPPRIRQGFIPKRACWLHLQAGWWRLFRRAALAGRSLPTPVSSSTPRGWPPASSTGALGRGVGPSAPPTRKLRRKFVYRL